MGLPLYWQVYWWVVHHNVPLCGAWLYIRQIMSLFCSKVCNSSPFLLAQKPKSYVMCTPPHPPPLLPSSPHLLLSPSVTASAHSLVMQPGHLGLLLLRAGPSAWGYPCAVLPHLLPLCSTLPSPWGLLWAPCLKLHTTQLPRIPLLPVFSALLSFSHSTYYLRS